MTQQIIHRVEFRQGPDASMRSAVFHLRDLNVTRRDHHKASSLEGRWTQRKSESQPEGIDLYPNFTSDDKLRLVWRWDSTQHGGLLQVGVTASSATETYYTAWFSFRGAKRLASGRFEVAGATPPLEEGDALYELHGSNTTFQHGSGRWVVSEFGRG